MAVWRPPGRPGLRPHIRLPRCSRRAGALQCHYWPSPGRRSRRLCAARPPARQGLLLSRTVLERREVALRGPFCLRLASACRCAAAHRRNHGPGRTPHLQPSPVEPAL